MQTGNDEAMRIATGTFKTCFESSCCYLHRCICNHIDWLKKRGVSISIYYTDMINFCRIISVYTRIAISAFVSYCKAHIVFNRFRDFIHDVLNLLIWFIQDSLRFQYSPRNLISSIIGISWPFRVIWGRNTVSDLQ